MHNFRPTADFATLRLRAALLARLRDFFQAAGYLEVETPLLSSDCVVDAHLEPFITRYRPNPADDRGTDLYLQTSPEFAHKRLLAAGSGPIFEVFRACRNGEAGARHNPEFTLIEWYRPGDTHLDQMTFTEALIRHLYAADELQDAACQRLRDAPFERLRYDAAFARYAGTPVLALSVAELAQVAAGHSVAVPESLTVASSHRDEWLNLLLSELVEPHLGQTQPTFLYDYPASQAALAIVRDDVPPVAERFELYLGGVELCNGYHELRDAHELRRRNAGQNARRVAGGLRPLPEDSRLLSAMEQGLPACAGVAFGFDRLLMVALGRTNIGQVRAFLTET